MTRPIVLTWLTNVSKHVAARHGETERHTGETTFNSTYLKDSTQYYHVTTLRSFFVGIGKLKFQIKEIYLIFAGNFCTCIWKTASLPAGSTCIGALITRLCCDQFIRGSSHRARLSRSLCWCNRISEYISISLPAKTDHEIPSTTDADRNNLYAPTRLSI